MAVSSTPQDKDILPSNVKPSHYKLKICNIELGGNFGYDGEVDITVDVLRKTLSLLARNVLTETAIRNNQGNRVELT